MSHRAADHYTEYRWEAAKTGAHDYIIPRLIKIIKRLGISQDSKILDAGCGGGALVSILYSQCDFKNIYGFDASESGIELAKKSFPDLADNFLIHSAYESKLPSNIPQKYDLIISMEVIEHLYSPETYLQNINRWLEDSGYLVLTTPYHGYLKNMLIAFLNKSDKHYDPLSEGGHIKFFSRRKLCRLLEEKGFKPLRFYGSGRFPYIWKSMVVVAQKI